MRADIIRLQRAAARDRRGREEMLAELAAIDGREGSS